MPCLGITALASNFFTGRIGSKQEAENWVKDSKNYIQKMDKPLGLAIYPGSFNPPSLMQPPLLEKILH